MQNGSLICRRRQQGRMSGSSGGENLARMESAGIAGWFSVRLWNTSMNARLGRR